MSKATFQAGLAAGIVSGMQVVQRIIRKAIAVFLEKDPLGRRVPPFPADMPYKYNAASYYAGVFGLGGYTRLFSSETPITVDASGKIVVSASAVSYNLSGDTWVLRDAAISENGSRLIWANHNIYNSSGSLVVEGFDAIPLYGIETLFDGEIDFVLQDGYSEPVYAYKFAGLPLTPTDYKVIEIDNFVPYWRLEGSGNLSGTCSVNGYTYTLTGFFDEAGSFWLATDTDIESVPVVIQKYIL